MLRRTTDSSALCSAVLTILCAASCGDGQGSGINNANNNADFNANTNTNTNTNSDLCGNGQIDPAEDCDGSNLAGQSCQSLGYSPGILACEDSCHWDTSQCDPPVTCGDGLRQPPEQCDSADLHGHSCISRGFDGGSLGCTASCMLDETGCFVCGEGVLNGSESCDGSDFGIASCTSETGFTSGSLSCSASCTIETTGCYSCGNGSVDGPEACEAGIIGADNCLSLTGLSEGFLTCQFNCLAFDTSDCHECGNSSAEGPELCDMGDLGGATCQSVGFAAGGTLACQSDCSFDLTECCGDGTIAGAELCDDGNLEQYDGCFTCAVDDIHVSGSLTEEEYRPRVTHGPGGQIIVVFNDDDGTDVGLAFRRFGANGLPLNPAQQISSVSARDNDVAANSAGQFAAVWTVLDSVLDVIVWARIIDETDTPVGPAFIVSQGAGYKGGCRIAMAPSGWFVVTWQGQDSDDWGIYARVYDATGTPVTDEFIVNLNESGVQLSPDVAIGTNDDFVIVYHSGTWNGARVFGRRYYYDSTPYDGPFEIYSTSSTSYYQVGPRITARPGGGHLVVWRVSDGNDNPIQMRELDATATPTGPRYEVVPSSYPLNQSYYETGIDSGGGFVVVWARGFESTGDADGDQAGVLVRRFNAAATLLGTTTIVNIKTQGEQKHSDLTVLPDGRFAVVWWDHDFSGATPAPMLQRFTPAGQHLGSLPW